MSPQFGRCALRSYPLSSYTIQCRVNFRPVVFQRVAAAYHIETGGQQLLTHSVPFSKAHICAQRNYATRPASRPKAHTGRTISSPRKKKSSVTVAPGEGSTKTVTIKTGKPKATAGAKAKPKAKTKAKPKVKTRATVKAKTKAKPARKVKKVKKDLSEEQLAKAAKTEQNTKIRELKKVALRVPKLLPSTAYTVVASELAKGTHALEGRVAAEKYRNLVPEELEVSIMISCPVSGESNRSCSTSTASPMRTRSPMNRHTALGLRASLLMKFAKLTTRAVC